MTRSGACRSVTAVVADSNHEFGHWLTRTLESHGLQARWTPSGEEALSWTQAHPPDLFFVSSFLKDKLGFEVIDAVRRAPKEKQPTVVLVGAIFRTYRYHSTPRQLYGADAYIEEGVTESEIFDLLADLKPDMFRRGEDAAPAAPAEAEAFEPPTDLAEAPGTKARAASVPPPSAAASPSPAPPPRAARVKDGGAHVRAREEVLQGGAGADGVLREARTLAEIIISDIYIYKPIRARRAILRQRFEDAFADEIRIGREYFEKRFPPEALAGRDVFREALDDFMQLKLKEYKSLL